MIIFGIRVIYQTLSEGVFLCPNERADRPYALKLARRFFALFFIPLIPLNVLGNVVHCQSCFIDFEPVVLDRPTAAQQADSFFIGLRGAVVAVLRSGTGSQISKSQALRLVSHYVPEYNEANLEHDLYQFDLSTLPAQLQLLATTLDEHGRESLLTHLVLIAAADKGGVNDAERSSLELCGTYLEMTPAHFRGTIELVIEQATTH